MTKRGLRVKGEAGGEVPDVSPGARGEEAPEDMTAKLRDARVKLRKELEKVVEGREETPDGMLNYFHFRRRSAADFKKALAEYDEKGFYQDGNAAWGEKKE